MGRPSMKEDIVQAALKVLHQRGFNATGVQDITDAAGVPKGSFYNHFESKEDLGIEALDRYWQKLLAGLEILKDEALPPLARLRTYFRELNRISEKPKFRLGCMVGNMSVEMSGHSTKMRDHLASIFVKWTRAIEVCVRAAQKDGSLRRDMDAETISNFLLNAWEGAVLRSKVDRNGKAQEAFETVIFNSLLTKG
jgi:TetR/AcrR family transcriptional regulator, transcriptional repressor for nem operon